MADGWDLFWTALVGGFAGALAAGVLGFAVAREAQRREARARILRKSLHELHDQVNDETVGQRGASEPSGQPPAIGVAYSALMRDAAAASAADYRWLAPFQAVWDEAGEVFGRFYRARTGRGGELSTDDSMAFAAEQLPIWERMNDLLKGYDGWLIWQLTRPWWWPVTPRQHRRRRVFARLGLPNK
jgi:hypothetical protein